MAEQIFEPGSLDSPTTYQASGVHDIVVLDCYAEFGGSGAGADYKPALRFRSQAGHIIAVATTDETVTAGDDADVSWFRGVKAGGSSAPTSTGFAYSRGYSNALSGDPNIVVPAHGNIKAPFAHIDADSTGKITWTTAVNPNDTAVLHGPGVGLFLSTVQYQTNNLGIAGFAYDLSGDQLPHMSWGGQGILDTPALTSGIGLPTDEDFTCVRVGSGATENVSLLLQQNGNVNLNCKLAYMAILFWVGA